MANKCPECGALLEIRDVSTIDAIKYSSSVKDSITNGKALVCSNYPKCDNYVFITSRNSISRLRVANDFLRTLRINTHKVFDIIWQSGATNRNSAYLMIEKALSQSKSHISYCGVYDCIKLIVLSLNYLSKNFDKIDFNALSKEQLNILKFAAEFEFNKNSINFSGKELYAVVALAFNNKYKEVAAVNKKMRTCTVLNKQQNENNVYIFNGTTLLQCALSIITELYNDYAVQKGYKTLKK